MFRPFALCSLLLAGTVVLADAGLKPYQQDALDRLLATMDAPMREMMRPQLEQTLKMMTEPQVAMMLGELDGAFAEAEPEPEPEAEVVDPAALAHNRAQYEPALRRAWAADSAFDRFVDARLAAGCPAEGSYAVFGSAWRFEVMPLTPSWTRASQSADADVDILGASYAPQDGRYRFDFSGLRDSFDEQAVAGAIDRACSAYRAVGETFMAEAKKRLSETSLDAGPALEADANSKASRINEELKSALEAQAPNAKSVVLLALVNGEREG